MSARRTTPAWAWIALPALAIVALYVLWPRAALARQIAMRNEELARTSLGAPRPEARERVAADLEALQRRIAERERALAAPAEPRASDASRASSHAERREAVARLFVRHRLVLVEESDAPRDVLEAFAPLVRALPLGGALEPAAVRRVLFEGSYADVQAALAELASPAVGALPLSLSMERARAGRLAWTLVWT